METIFQMKDVVKDYKGNLAINNGCMTIKKGDIYGFVGENGAGKSTVIRLICGLISPTSGSYELFGVNNKSKELHLARKKIAAIVENVAISPNLSAYGNLVAQAKLLGIKEKSVIENTLYTVGLGNVVHDKKKAKNFSLGMKQRLGIATALLSNPEFIILDEPTNGLDPTGIMELRELVLRLNKEKGVTFLISSHNLDELSKMATRFGFITRGKIVKEVQATEIKSEIMLENMFREITRGDI